MRKGPLFSFLILAFVLLISQRTMATHNRAGELTYAFIGPNTIQLTISTWTKASSTGADRDTLAIHWGDGSPDLPVARINGPIGTSGIPNGVLLGNDVKYNVYVGTHSYQGTPPPPNNFYVVSMTDPNRNSAIINIQGGNSVNVQFYIEDTIFYPTNIQDVGYDHSPICLNPPIDFAYVGDTFWHNPAAFDIDGDSISFRQIVPLQGEGMNVPGFQDPTCVQVGCGQANDMETLNVHTGMYMWATPQLTGIYNVAFIISEYRRGFLLGTIDRDMQIIVLEDTTTPPVVHIPQDTCIRAGDRLQAIVTGTDKNAAHTVTLTGYGGPLAGDPAIFPDSLSPATFTNGGGGPVIQGNPALGVFNWNTVCLDIRAQPYEMVFKAENNNVNPKIDLKTWNVLVIPPPPLNLVDTIQHRHVQLHWTNPYKCDSIHTFRGFSIWRRINSNPFVPEYCETGLAGRGYTMIASGVFDTSYIDLTAVHGQDLCYRILAHFSDKSPNGLYEYNKVVSVPSNEYCIYLPYDVPVIIKASVEQTDKAAGTIFTAFTRPRVGGTSLDTIIDPPPYRFDIYRGVGQNFANPILVHSSTAASYSAITDTTYLDTGLNTEDSSYSYQVWFYSAGDTIGSSDKASSVYLNTFPTDSKIRLSWSFNVPWTQDSFQIYRQNYNASNPFVYIATDTIQTTLAYIDTGLINDSSYCYYVKAFGHYTSPYIGEPLTDSSEIKCAIPIDTIPPCPPVTTVTNDCGQSTVDSFLYINYLNWVESDSCGFTTVKYRIYYAPDTGGAYTLIDSLTGITSTSYNHLLHFSLAGCYIVTAVDKRGNESHKINQVCIDDCPNYDLPNTFTPNGDGVNDLYTPYHPYRFITRVDFKIFTRWGDKVFETTDPELKWDGKDQKSGKDLSDGVYLYGGYYYEQTLHGEVRKPLPHKNGGGFIHLIRNK